MTIEDYRKHLFECQRIAVIAEGEGELTDQEVNKRCLELQKQIMDAENINKRFFNPVLHKIFNSPPRIKRSY